MNEKSLKEWVQTIAKSAIDVRALINELGGHFVALEEARTKMEVVRFNAITDWVRELRKEGGLGSSDAGDVVCAWITQSQSAARDRATNIAQILSSVGSPVVQILLPWLISKHPEWFAGGEAPGDDEEN